eukprot:scaffold156149_cov33-Attheya_sp.AAC.1
MLSRWPTPASSSGLPQNVDATSMIRIMYGGKSRVGYLLILLLQVPWILSQLSNLTVDDPNTETNGASGATSDVPSSGSKQGTAANPETDEMRNNTRSQSNVKDQKRELKSVQTSCGHGQTSGKDEDYKAEALSQGSKQGSDANPETEEESNNTHSRISGSEPGVAACSESEKNVTRTNLKAASFLGGTTDDKLLKAIDREKRERKATKLDDAKVPVYLWEEHMINDGDFGRTTADLPRMRPLMGACRVLMLKWWKRK